VSEIYPPPASLTVPESGHPKGELRMGLAHVYNFCGSTTENTQGNDPVQEFMVAGLVDLLWGQLCQSAPLPQRTSSRFRSQLLVAH
jgi:hypothetical protein